MITKYNIALLVAARRPGRYQLPLNHFIDDRVNFMESAVFALAPPLTTNISLEPYVDVCFFRVDSVTSKPGRTSQ